MKKAALSDVFSDAAEVAGRYAKHGGQVLKRNLLQHILKKTFFDEAQVPADFPVCYDLYKVIKTGSIALHFLQMVNT